MFFSGNLLKQSEESFAIQKLTYFERATMPELHYHDHYEILYVTENERLLTVNERTYTLNNHNIAVIPPYIPHLTESGELIPQKRILINFRENYIHDIRKALHTDILSCFNPSNPIINFEDSEKTSVLINRILEASPYNNEHTLLYLSDFLLYLCELTEFCTGDTSFFEVIKYVEENFSKKITLDLLAEKFYTNKYTILRKFKNYTGMGLPKYLNTIRLINAKKRLAKGEKIINIALSCGFGSLSNFDRVFLAETGITPKEYKQSCTK